MFVGQLKLVFVNKYRDVSHVRKIQKRRKECGRGDASVLCGGHVSEHTRDQSPTYTVPDHIDVGLAGCLFDGVDGLKRPLKKVVRKAFVREFGTRFTRPVYVPDDADGATVEFTGVVSALDPEARTAKVDVTAKFNGQTILGRARATVQLS